MGMDALQYGRRTDPAGGKAPVGSTTGSQASVPLVPGGNYCHILQEQSALERRPITMRPRGECMVQALGGLRIKAGMSFIFIG
jgi:hypothetical protein